MSFPVISTDGKTASFKAPASFYSKESARLAALVFESDAAVRVKGSTKFLEISITPRRKTAAAGLEALAGEFLNEILNQEYRLLVGRFNARVGDLIVTQALFSANGTGRKPASRAAENTREYKAEVDRLLQDARAELKTAQPWRTPRA